MTPVDVAAIELGQIAEEVKELKNKADRLETLSEMFGEEDDYFGSS